MRFVITVHSILPPPPSLPTFLKGRRKGGKGGGGAAPLPSLPAGVSRIPEYFGEIRVSIVNIFFNPGKFLTSDQYIKKLEKDL